MCVICSKQVVKIYDVIYNICRTCRCKHINALDVIPFAL